MSATLTSCSARTFFENRAFLGSELGARTLVDRVLDVVAHRRVPEAEQRAQALEQTAGRLPRPCRSAVLGFAIVAG